jgi:hypothetical protein
MNKNGLRVSEYSGLVHMVRFDIVKYSKFNIRNLWYRAIVQIFLSVIPNSYIIVNYYQLFSRIIILAEGRITYLGPSNEAVSYFGRYVCYFLSYNLFRDKYSKLNILELVFIFRRGSSPVENEIAIKTIFHWCLYAVYNISLSQASHACVYTIILFAYMKFLACSV